MRSYFCVDCAAIYCESFIPHLAMLFLMNQARLGFSPQMEAQRVQAVLLTTMPRRMELLGARSANLIVAPTALMVERVMR